MTFNQVVRGSSPRWLTKLEDCITMQSFFILLCSKFLMPKIGNLYPNNVKPSKRVEIPSSPGCKFLPKQRKSAEKVENPRAAVRKSLPKQRKSTEKGRDSSFRPPEISTQMVEIDRKGRESQCRRL